MPWMGEGREGHEKRCAGLLLAQKTRAVFCPPDRLRTNGDENDDDSTDSAAADKAVAAVAPWAVS